MEVLSMCDNSCVITCESQPIKLIDNEDLISIFDDRNILEPAEEVRNGVSVREETAKKHHGKEDQRRKNQGNPKVANTC